MKTSRPILTAILLALLGSASLTCKEDPTNPKSEPLVAKMSVSATSGEAPLAVRYTDISIGDITSRRFDFEDGSSSIATYVDRTYTQAGHYWAKLTVSGPAGTTSVTEIVNVTAPQPRITLSDMRATSDNTNHTVTLTVDAQFKNYANQPRVLGVYWVRSSGSSFAFQSSNCSVNTPNHYLGFLKVLSTSSSDHTFNDVGATIGNGCFPVTTAGTTYYGYAVVYDRIDINAVTNVNDPALANLGPPSTVVTITFR